MQGNMFITLLVWLAIGALSSYIAKKRGRRPQVWFFIGTILGLVGLITLYLLPDLSKPAKEALLVNPDSPPKITSYSTEEHSSGSATIESKPFMGVTTYPWYYIDESLEQKGPVDLIILKQLHKEKKLNQSNYVWTEGMKDWKEIHELLDLDEELNK